MHYSMQKHSASMIGDDANMSFSNTILPVSADTAESVALNMSVDVFA